MGHFYQAQQPYGCRLDVDDGRWKLTKGTTPSCDLRAGSIQLVHLESEKDPRLHVEYDSQEEEPVHVEKEEPEFFDSLNWKQYV
jgi:hypothetical protein